jgi:hypothetical protein
MTARPIDSANTELPAGVAGRVNKPLSPDGIAAEVEKLLSSVPLGGAE